MSVKISGAMWEVECKYNERLVLLCLADHADHTGRRAFPGTDLLAWKTGYSKRTVQAILSDLRNKGWIEAENGLAGGPGKATSYRIRVDRIPQKPPYRKGDDSAPLVKSAKGDEADAPRVMRRAPKGDGPITPTSVNRPLNRPSPLTPAAAGDGGSGVEKEPTAFERYRAAYPKRIGGHRWKIAEKALRARIREGFDLDTIIEAVGRYTAFVEATGKIGTEKTMQAASFIGDAGNIEDDWEIPPPEQRNGNGRRRGQGELSAEEERRYYERQKREAERREAKVEEPQDVWQWKRDNPDRARAMWEEIAYGKDALELAKTEKPEQVEAFIDRAMILRVQKEMA